MNKEWSQLNKTMQLQIKNIETFEQGIETLLSLRKELMKEILTMKQDCTDEDFYNMPFPKAKGYHCKTIAYSLWHIFRIEDIVVHTLIQEDEQVFFKKNYQKQINASIITTGNELNQEEIIAFSKQLNLEALYQYIKDVNESTAKMLKTCTYQDLRKTVSSHARHALEISKTVNEDEHAWWLIDYWCSKDLKGLIQMPLSRHWIMHIEASLRIKERINR